MKAWTWQFYSCHYAQYQKLYMEKDECMGNLYTEFFHAVTPALFSTFGRVAMSTFLMLFLDAYLRFRDTCC